MKRCLWIARLAALNLRRNVRRNLITGLALAGSFAGILLFTGFTVWVEKYLRVNTVYLNQAGHLTISRPGAMEMQLTKPKAMLMDSQQISALERILVTEDRLAMVGRGLQSLALLVKDCRSRGVIILGRDPTIDQANAGHPEVLRWSRELLNRELPEKLLAFEAIRAEEMAVFPTKPIKAFISSPARGESRVGCEATPPNSLQLVGRDIDGRVVAADGIIVSEQSTGLSIMDERTIYLPLPDLQKLLATDRVASFSIYLKDITELPWVWRSLEQKISDAKLDLEVLPFFHEAVGLFYVGSVLFVVAIAGFFTVLTVTVVGLTLFSLFSMSANERSVEIGLLLSVGFPSKIIERLFIWESLLLALLSLGAGFLTAYGVGALVYSSNLRFAPPGIAGDTRLTIAWEPFVVLSAAGLFLLATFLCVRLVTHLKLRKSLIHLLQNSSTL